MRDKRRSRTDRTCKSGRIVATCLAFLTIMSAPGLLRHTASAQSLGPMGPFNIITQDWGSTFQWLWFWDGRLEATETLITSLPDTTEVPAPGANEQYYFRLKAHEFATGLEFMHGAGLTGPPYLFDAAMGEVVLGEIDGGIQVFDRTGTVIHTSADLDIRDVGFGPDEMLWILTDTELLHYDYTADPDPVPTSNPFDDTFTFNNAQNFTFVPVQMSWTVEGPWIAEYRVHVVEEAADTSFQIRTMRFDPNYIPAWVDDTCVRNLGAAPPLDIVGQETPSGYNRLFVIYAGDDTIYELDGVCGSSTDVVADDADEGVSGPRSLWLYNNDVENTRLTVLMDWGELIRYEVSEWDSRPYTRTTIHLPNTTLDWAVAHDRYDLDNFYAIENVSAFVQRWARFGTLEFQCDTTAPIHIITTNSRQAGDSLFLDTETEGFCQTGSNFWQPTFDYGRMDGFIVDWAEAPPASPAFDLTTTYGLGPFPDPYDVEVVPTVNPGEILVTVEHADITATGEIEQVNIYGMIMDDYGDGWWKSRFYGGGCRPCGFEGLYRCHGNDELYRNYHQTDYYYDDDMLPVLIATQTAGNVSNTETDVIVSNLPEDMEFVVTAGMAYGDRAWTGLPFEPWDVGDVTTGSATGIGNTCGNAIPNPVINTWGSGTYFANMLPPFGETTWYDYDASVNGDGLLIVWPEFEYLAGWIIGAAYRGSCDPLISIATLDLSFDGLMFEVDGDEPEPYHLQLTTFGSSASAWYGLFFPLDELEAVNFDASEGLDGVIDFTWDEPALADETLFTTRGLLTYYITYPSGDPENPFEVFPIEENRTVPSASLWPLTSPMADTTFSLYTGFVLGDGSRVLGAAVPDVGSALAIAEPTGLPPISGHEILFNSEARDIYLSGALVRFEDVPFAWQPNRWRVSATAPGEDPVVVDVTGGRLAAAVPIPTFGIWDLTLTSYHDGLGLQSGPEPFAAPFDACALAHELFESPPPGDPEYRQGQFRSHYYPNQMSDLQIDRSHFFRFNPGVDPMGANEFYIGGKDAFDMEVFEGTNCFDLELIASYEYEPTFFDFQRINFGFTVDEDPATSLFFLITPVAEWGEFTYSLWQSDPDDFWSDWVDFVGGFGAPGRSAPGWGGMDNPAPVPSINIERACGGTFDFTYTLAPLPGYFTDPVPFVTGAIMLDGEMDFDKGPDPDELIYLDIGELGTEPWTSDLIEGVELDPEAQIGALVVLAMANGYEDECDGDGECGSGQRCSEGSCHETCMTDWDCQYQDDWCDMSGICQWDDMDAEVFAYEIVRFSPPPAGDTNPGCAIDVTDVVNVVAYFWASRPPTPDYNEMARAIPVEEPVMQLDVALGCTEIPRNLENCINMGYAVAISQIILEEWEPF